MLPLELGEDSVSEMSDDSNWETSDSGHGLFCATLAKTERLEVSFSDFDSCSSRSGWFVEALLGNGRCSFSSPWIPESGPELIRYPANTDELISGCGASTGRRCSSISSQRPTSLLYATFVCFDLDSGLIAVGLNSTSGLFGVCRLRTSTGSGGGLG